MEILMVKASGNSRNIVRRFVVAAAVAAAFFALSAPSVFAAGGTLSLLETSPEVGSSNLQSQNVGIKLFFDGDVTAESVQKANANCFKFTQSGGKETKELPVKAYFDNRGNTGYILAIVDTDDLEGSMLAYNTSYKLTISGDLVSADGKTLGSDKVLDFKTVDQSGTTRIYMLLMVGMVAFMIATTIFQNKRKETAAAEVAAKGGKVNPYKLAKDKKITVKEAMELIERDRKRRLKRLGMAEGKDEMAAAAAAEKPRDTKKVKRPRPIADAGSTYRTGRSAAMEKQAAKAAEKSEKANTAKKTQKNMKAKSKSKKKGKKK
jgi:hypothetical protein